MGSIIVILLGLYVDQTRFFQLSNCFWQFKPGSYGPYEFRLLSRMHKAGQNEMIKY